MSQAKDDDRASRLWPTIAPALQVSVLLLLTIGANILVSGVSDDDFLHFVILAVFVTASSVLLASIVWRRPLSDALEYRSFLRLLPDLLVRQSLIGIDDEVFAEYERSTSATHIIIVTDEIMSPLGGSKSVDADYIAIMQANIKRGIEYLYIFPDRDYIRQRRESIMQRFASGVTVVTLPDRDWSQLPLSVGEYCIFEMPDLSPAEIYVVQDPSPGSRSWARVSGRYAERWIGRTKLVLDEVGNA